MFPPVLAVTALVAAQLIIAQGPQCFEFKGVPFGASRAEILPKFPFVQCGESPDERVFDTICITRASVLKAQDFIFGGVPIKFGIVTLLADALTGVTLMIAPDDYQRLSRAMAEGYEKPDGVEQEALQTRERVKIANETTHWVIGQVTTRLRKYFPMIETGTVSMVTKTNINEFKEFERQSVHNVIKGPKGLQGDQQKGGPAAPLQASPATL